MEETITQSFERVWNDFLSLFKGNLLTEAAKQELTLASARLMLAEAKLTWTTEYSLCGAWLSRLRKEDPRKGELVKTILTDDMKLSEAGLESYNGSAVKIAVPVGVGIAGFLISHFAGAGIIVQAGSTLIPAALTYPLSTQFVKDRRTKVENRIIDNYVAQLNKYKRSAISALLAE